MSSVCGQCNTHIQNNNECCCLSKDEWSAVRDIKSKFVGNSSGRNIAMYVWRAFFDLKKENITLKNTIDSLYASKPREIARAVTASSAQLEARLSEMERYINTLESINAGLRVKLFSTGFIAEGEGNGQVKTNCTTCQSSTTCYCR